MLHSLFPAQVPQSHSAGAIRDTVESVFRGREYLRSTGRTVGDIVFDLIGRLLDAIATTLRESPPLRYFLFWSGIALLVIALIRFVYVAVQTGRLGASRTPQQRAGVSAADALAAAQRAAAEGRFTDAVHLLYAGLLDTLARQERLRLHPSKTAGDYARELRAKSSPTFAPFRAFVRAFEIVVYRRGECDREQFERIRALAEPLLVSGK